MAGIAMIVAGAVQGLTSLGMGLYQNHVAQEEARRQKIEARKQEAELAKLEALRQPVINQADEIRALKEQVTNPYQNLGVAMQGVNIKMQETDEALANTLNAINQSGAGAGAATALARQAAASKAQVAATIEKQELQNQQLYLQGEQQKVGQQMALEQAAIQEEIGAFGRQEERDIMKMGRLAGLQQNALQMAAQYGQMGQSAMTAGLTGFASGLGTVAQGITELE